MRLAFRSPPAPAGTARPTQPALWNSQDGACIIPQGQPETGTASEIPSRNQSCPGSLPLPRGIVLAKLALFNGDCLAKGSTPPTGIGSLASPDAGNLLLSTRHNQVAPNQPAMLTDSHISQLRVYDDD